MSETPIDRQNIFSGTRPPLPEFRIDPIRLSQYLENQIEDFRGPLSIRQFNGGQSNPTYQVETATGDYVLRRKPPGKLLPSAHAVEREFRIMQALGKVGFPVPNVLCLCEDVNVIGTPFYIMDYVEGRVVWVPAMPDSNPAERSAVFAAMTDRLADLHMLDPGALGLADYGRGENYVARQISRWSEQYRTSRTAEITEMEGLIEWLPTKIPRQDRVAIVHGDFRLDNLILDPGHATIRAVIDWELSTLGDPVADFANFLMQWKMPPTESGAGTGSLVSLDLDALGIPSMDTVIEFYEARTGLAVRPALEFYLAYNLFRIAAILQGIVGRAREGTATNPMAPAMATQVRPIAEIAWRIAHGETAT
jgi:aminoglycoside phosphotransferase (APT) family kinase protein